MMPTRFEMRLHYLAGRIDVELVLPLARVHGDEETDGLRRGLSNAAAALPWFGNLRVLYE